MAIFKECMHCVSTPSHSHILHLFQFAGEITNPHIYKFLSPPPSPHSTNLYLRQQKNNQSQMNTTGGQNWKEFNNTAGWLTVLFCNEFIK